MTLDQPTDDDRSRASEASLAKMRKYATAFAAKSGTFLHPQPEITEFLVIGLAQHLEQLGRPLCPCNFYPDKAAEAQSSEWICACDEMQRYKYCHCLLFVNEAGLPITEYLPEGHEGRDAYGVIADPDHGPPRGVQLKKGRPAADADEALEQRRRAGVALGLVQQRERPFEGHRAAGSLGDLRLHDHASRRHHAPRRRRLEVEHRVAASCERGELAPVLLKACEEPGDRGGRIHHRRDDRRVLVDARARRGDAGRDRADRLRRQFEERHVPRDPPARRQPVRVPLVRAGLADEPQRRADAPVQFARGLLELFERQRVEDGRVGHAAAPDPRGCRAYASAMNDLGWGMQLAIFVALVVNLWFGGDIIEEHFGHVVRAASEITLIGTWLVLVMGMRAPLPWRRRKPEDEEPPERR